MIEEGLVDEVRHIYDSTDILNSTARQAIGYKELFDYLDDNCTLERSIYEIKLRSRHYAKRQLTWFRYMNDRHIINIDDVDLTLNYIIEEIS